MCRVSQTLGRHPITETPSHMMETLVDPGICAAFAG
jgi:hypothetical protein